MYVVVVGAGKVGWNLTRELIGRGNEVTVVVRVLDPARATWYEEQGLRTVCPTKIAIEMLEDAVGQAVSG